MELSVIRDAAPEIMELESRSLLWYYHAELARKMAKEKRDILPSSRAQQSELDKELKKEALKDLDERPWIAKRRCYLHMLCDDCPIGPQWTNPNASSVLAHSMAELEVDQPESLTTFAELGKLFQEIVDAASTVWATEKAAQKNNGLKRPSKSYLVKQRYAVVRVLAKTRLTYFGSVEKDDPWPYKFSLRVIDHDGTEVNVDLWGAVCPASYYGIEPGTLLKLSSMKLREVYAHHPTEFVSLVSGERVKPVFEVTIQPEKNHSHGCRIIMGGVKDHLDFIPRSPPPIFIDTLSTRISLAETEHASISALADAPIKASMTSPLHSVAGLVLFVGPLEVQTTFGFSQLTRWILLSGAYTASPHMLVHLTANSDAQSLSSLKLGDPVILSHLRIEPHHSHFLGVSTIYSTIQIAPMWPCVLDLDTEKKHFRDVVQTGAHNWFKPGWTPSVKCTSIVEYLRLYAAAMIQSIPKKISFLPFQRKNIVQAGSFRFAMWIASNNYLPNMTGWLSQPDVDKIACHQGSQKFRQGPRAASFLWICFFLTEPNPQNTIQGGPGKQYCAVIPITPAHLCSGDVVQYESLVTDSDDFTFWICQEFNIRTNSNILFSSSVIRTDRDIKHTLTNIWSDSPKNRRLLRESQDKS